MSDHDDTVPAHPGQILLERVMQPLGISRNQLARDIDVPVGRISDITNGKRGITADTALRLGRYFGVPPQLWLRLQAEFDLYTVRTTSWRESEGRVRVLESAKTPFTSTAEPSQPPPPPPVVTVQTDSAGAEMAVSAVSPEAFDTDPSEGRVPAPSPAEPSPPEPSTPAETALEPSAPEPVTVAPSGAGTNETAPEAEEVGVAEFEPAETGDGIAIPPPPDDRYR